MNDLQHLLAEIWRAYSGEAAWQAVADLSRFHRIQASPGYRQAAQLITQRLKRDGVEAHIILYPAEEQSCFWAWPSFQEWDCTAATLHLVAPQDEAKQLADFRACPISLIQRSAAFAGETEVTLLEDGEEEEDYHGLDVAGKVVLSRGDLRRVWEMAVEQRGAVGILFDGMRVVKPVRPEGDLADVHQYTSFWWQPGDTKCFGFVLTPRQGQALRRLLKKAEEPVRVRARVVSRFYDGAMEVVSATIPGETTEEVLVTAHLCHPQPSANDNASGAAAAMEAARTLQALIARDKLPLPRRTIRFLWMPEMTGTFAYLSEHESELDQLIAGINLDMVGEEQGQTGSSWLLERPPDAAASFAPDLLAHLRDELLGIEGMVDVSPSHTGLGEYPLFRLAEVGFSGGSDHFVLSDPTVGVPTPMLIQWPDRYYHTAADTPDRTDPNSLARAGTLAAAYAYWLATAGVQEATWLGYQMAARFKTQLVDTAQGVVTQAMTLDSSQDMARIVGELDRRLAYLLGRYKAALVSLRRLASLECLVTDLQADGERATQRELSWANGAIDLHAAGLGFESLPDLPVPSLSAEEQQARALVPVRQVRGPIPFEQYLRRLDKEDRESWRQLLKARKDRAHHTLMALALYWADGDRSILEIADLIELETGTKDLGLPGLLMSYFRLLEKLGLISFH